MPSSASSYLAAAVLIVAWLCFLDVGFNVPVVALISAHITALWDWLRWGRW
jgi:MFS superfamily sulfate permease-like transporter